MQPQQPTAAAAVTSESSGGSTTSEQDGVAGGTAASAAPQHPTGLPIEDTGMEITTAASSPSTSPGAIVHGNNCVDRQQSKAAAKSDKKRRRPSGFLDNTQNSNPSSVEQQQRSIPLRNGKTNNYAFTNGSTAANKTEVTDSISQETPMEQDETTAATSANGSAPDDDKGNEQQEQQSASSLPQHQLVVKDVTPLDITYRSTPASIRLKESLVTRLAMSFPSGRIQVVREDLVVD